MKILEALQGFFKERHARGCGENAMKAYRQHCGLFCEYLLERGVSDVEQMSGDLLQDFIESLRTRSQLGNRSGKLSPVTIHKRMKHVRTFLLWLSRKGCISNDVVYSFPMPKLRRRLPKGLSPEQVRLLLSAKMSVRDHAILSLILDSGLRVGEVASLTLEDLDLGRGVIQVRHGKGDKERLVLFGTEEAKILRAWFAVRKTESEFVFIDKLGRALKKGGIYKVVKRVAKSVDLKVHPHALRHTYATEFLNAGGLVTDLQLLMGHDQITTTMIYSHVAIERVRERFAGLSLVNRFSEEKQKG